MLTRISRSTAHALGLSFSTRGKSPRHTHDSVSVTEDTEEVIIDLDVLLLPVYDFLVPWWRNAGVECKRTISPVYNSIQNLLNAEVARITQLLLSLEPSDEYEDDEDEPFCEYSKAPCSIDSRPGTQSSYSERPPHRQVSECHPNKLRAIRIPQS
ncbi:hypothetical protein D9757_002260 [Collybiopsis confluens]|uniref:Uncharacterized protein n=1 Tax=Collybiopsis confluens TaxID=2823264 RepID=A0A8H5HZI6_9AGAR|nr:hypothetical protein D9757_002260 [Collybiopsis confluens]